MVVLYADNLHSLTSWVKELLDLLIIGDFFFLSVLLRPRVHSERVRAA